MASRNYYSGLLGKKPTIKKPTIGKSPHVKGFSSGRATKAIAWAGRNRKALAIGGGAAAIGAGIYAYRKIKRAKPTTKAAWTSAALGGGIQGGLVGSWVGNRAQKKLNRARRR